MILSRFGLSTASGKHSAPVALRQRGPIYALVFITTLFFLPSTVVMAGPLKSNGSPAIMLAVGAAVLLMMNFLSGQMPANPISPGSIVLIGVGLLQLTTWASGQTRSLSADEQAGTLRGIIGLVAYTAIALLVIKHVRTASERRQLIVAMVVGMSFCGMVGLLQGFANRDYRFLFQPPGFVLNREFDTQIRQGFVRVLGTSDSPIEYAVLMACLLALSVFLLRTTSKGPVRAVGFVGVAVGSVGIPSSVSRTGVVTLVVVVLIYSFSSTLRSLAGGLIAFAGVILMFALIDPARFYVLVDLFLNASSDTSVTSRTDDYSVVADAFRVYPIFGQGLGSNPPSASRFLDNQWLQAIVQGGVVGVLATATVFTAALFAAGAVARRRRSGATERNEGIAFLAAMAAILSSSFTFDLFSFQQVKYTFFILFGLAWSAYMDVSREDATLADNDCEEVA